LFQGTKPFINSVKIYGATVASGVMDGAMDGNMLGETDTTGSEDITGLSSSLLLQAANTENNAIINVRINRRFFIRFPPISLYLFMLTLLFYPFKFFLKQPFIDTVIKHRKTRPILVQLAHQAQCCSWQNVL
jgi:hypothetical protein